MFLQSDVSFLEILTAAILVKRSFQNGFTRKSIILYSILTVFSIVTSEEASMLPGENLNNLDDDIILKQYTWSFFPSDGNPALCSANKTIRCGTDREETAVEFRCDFKPMQLPVVIYFFDSSSRREPRKRKAVSVPYFLNNSNFKSCQVRYNSHCYMQII